MINAKVLGVPRLLKKFDKLPIIQDDILRKNIENAARVTRDTAVDKIQSGSKSGRVYDWRGLKRGEKADRFISINGKNIPVKNRKTSHRASAPGEAPAEDFGGMTKHITFFMSRPGALFHVAIIRGGFRAAKNLEFGTSKIKARPFLFPSFEEVKKIFRVRIFKESKQGLKRVSK